MTCVICGKGLKRKVTKCSTCLSKIRRIALKQRAVNYKGGSCKECGWTGCAAAFQFHHINPDEKYFEISKCQSLSWDKLVVELDKCLLLCANCHAIKHATRYHDQEILNAVEYYLLSWSTQKGTGKKRVPIAEYIPWNRKKAMIDRRKVERPDKDALHQMIWSAPIIEIAKQFNVSDTAIHKWIAFYELTKPPKGYWLKNNNINSNFR